MTKRGGKAEITDAGGVLTVPLTGWGQPVPPLVLMPSIDRRSGQAVGPDSEVVLRQLPAHGQAVLGSAGDKDEREKQGEQVGIIPDIGRPSGDPEPPDIPQQRNDK